MAAIDPGIDDRDGYPRRWEVSPGDAELLQHGGGPGTCSNFRFARAVVGTRRRERVAASGTEAAAVHGAMNRRRQRTCSWLHRRIRTR